MPWIFSYAELGPQQIEDMLGHAPFCALPASSPNSKVIFKGKSRKWGCATASLERSKSAWTYGSVHLVTQEEVALFDKYHQNYEQTYVPVLIDATKDKIKALTYVLNKESTVGQPNDDYNKSILKHLKFFWNQGDGANLTLEKFGITIPPVVEEKVEKVEKKTETVAGGIEDKPMRNRRRAKA